MTAPVITFMSDYGLDDDFVGVCHGVIASICPSVRVIDLTHGVARHDVRAGAVVLRDACRFMPSGVHLAVVDPGVGGDRRALALGTAAGRTFVGPDNGLLWPAASAAGGVTEAVDIGRSSFRLEPLSATFHGRDIFAPVAARLACGAALDEAGERYDPDQLVTLELPSASIADGVLVAHPLYFDCFGNVQLDAEASQLELVAARPGTSITVQLGGSEPVDARCVRTFSDVEPGQLLVYADSSGRVALAVRNGSAVSELGVSLDEVIRISL